MRSFMRLPAIAIVLAMLAQACILHFSNFDSLQDDCVITEKYDHCRTSQRALSYLPQLISSDTVLDLAGSPYIAENTTIDANLTIQAGVAILLNQSATITVNGRIRAQGSMASPVMFAANEGAWESIIISGLDGSTFDRCTFSGARRALYLNGISNVRMSNCTFLGGENSVRASMSDKVMIDNCTSNGTSADAYHFQLCQDIFILNCRTYNAVSCIYMSGCDRIAITQNDISNMTSEAVHADMSAFTIENSALENCSIGALAIASFDSVVKNNLISDASIGIMINISQNITIFENVLSGSNVGILVDNNDGINVRRNNIYGSATSGIVLRAASNCIVDGNNASGNAENGIELSSSSSNNLIMNCIADSNGKYGILVSNSGNNAIRTCNLSGNLEGIAIDSSSDIAIERSSFTNNGLGINFSSAPSCVANATSILGDDAIISMDSSPLISNSTIEGKMTIGAMGSITCRDTIYDKDSVVFQDATSMFVVEWSLTILVVDASGMPMSGICVYINDSASLGIVGSPFTTGASGLVGPYACVEYTSNDTTGDMLDDDAGERVYATPHAIEVDFAIPQMVNVTMNRTTFLAISPNGEYRNVSMKSPANNSAIRSGVQVHFSVMGDNTAISVLVTKGGGPIFSSAFRAPYVLDTTDWMDGEHSIEIEMTRFGMSVGKWQFAITIDNTPPTVTLSSPESISCVPPGTKATFAITDARIDYSFYYIDGTVNSFMPPYEIMFTRIGMVNLTIESYDTVGNIARVTYVVNVTSMPGVALQSLQNGSTITPGTPILLAVTNATYVRYSLDGGAWQDATSPYSIATSSWQVGARTLAVRAGNSCSETNVAFNFLVAGQNLPPSFTSTPVRYVVATQSYIYEASASDPEGGSVAFTLERAPSGMTLAGRNITWNPTIMQIGLHDVTICASDGTNVARQSFSIFVFSPPSSEDSKPAFSSTPLTSAYVGMHYSYDANASDAENDALMYEMLEGPSGMIMNATTGRMDWDPTSDEHGASLYVNMLVSISVTDGRSCAYQNYSITLFSRMNSKPTIVGEFKKMRFATEKKVSLVGKATDADDALSNLTWRASTTSNKIVVMLDAAKQQLIIRSTGKGMGKANFTLTLSDAFGANDTRLVEVEIVSAQRSSDILLYVAACILIAVVVIFVILFLFKREILEKIIPIKRKSETIHLGQLIPEQSYGQYDPHPYPSYQVGQFEIAPQPNNAPIMQTTTGDMQYAQVQQAQQPKRDIKLRPLGSVPEEFRLRYDKLEQDFASCDRMGIDIASAKASLAAAKESITKGAGYEDALKKCAADLKLALKKQVPILIRQYEKKIEDEEKSGKDATSAKDAVDKIETDFAGANYERIVESIKMAHAKLEKLKEMPPKQKQSPIQMPIMQQTHKPNEEQKHEPKPEKKEGAVIALDGNCYLLNEPDSKKSHESLRNLLDAGASAIWITRTPKDKLVQIYKIPTEDVQIFELFGVDSSDPAFILKTMKGYVDLGGKRAMIFDCLLYLLVRTNAKTVGKLLADIRSVMSGKECSCIVPLDFKVVDPADLKELEQNAKCIDDPSKLTFATPMEAKSSGQVIRCHICMGLVKPGLPFAKCECGKKFHDSCAKRVGDCPNCGRKL